MTHLPDTATKNPAELQRQMLSQLMDGEGSAADAQALARRWRDDESAQKTWHCYHLIGDVLRADTMAQPPQADEAFLARLRERLADAPRIAAPQTWLSAPKTTSRAMQSWLIGGAIAAGFVAVAGVLVVSRLAAPGAESASPVFAKSGQSAGVQRASVGAPQGALGDDPMSAALIRDAQIDSYLRAHRDMRGNATAALPGGALRSVDTIVPQR